VEVREVERSKQPHLTNPHFIFFLTPILQPLIYRIYIVTNATENAPSIGQALYVFPKTSDRALDVSSGAPQAVC